MYVKGFTAMAGVVSVLVASTTMAQGIRDAGSKMRGDYPYGYSRSERIVRQAPMAAQRAFSYQSAPAAPSVARQPAPGVRQYSYDSGQPQGTRVYSYAPAPLKSGRVIAPNYDSGIRDAGSKLRGDYGH